MTVGYPLPEVRSRAPARRWLYLPVEIKAREWESKILLAATAARAGFGAVIGQHSHLETMLPRLPSGVVFDRNYQRPRLPIVESRRASGHRNVPLDEEGMIAQSLSAFIKSRVSPDVIEASSAVCTWGTESTDAVAIRTAAPQAAGKLHATGHPRADLWRAEFRDLHRQSAEQLTAEYGRYVLFASSFAMVLHLDGRERLMTTFREQGLLDDQQGRDLFEAQYAYRKAILDHFHDALPRLAAALPDHTLIVRPHPGDNADYWRELAASAPNMQVVMSGPITPWILGAETVVHNNCTTGIETFLLGQPVIAYMPVVDPVLEYPLLNEVSQQASTVDELIDLVHANIAGQIPPPDAQIDRVRTFIASVDGPLACQRLVSLFGDLDLDEQVMPPPIVHRMHRQTQRVRAVARSSSSAAARRVTRRAPDKPPLSRAYRLQKFPGADVADVRAVIRGLDELSGSTRPLVVTALDNWVFSVTSDEPAA